MSFWRYPITALLLTALCSSVDEAKLIAGNRPTLPELQHFPVKDGFKNIVGEIANDYQSFGILLLKDEKGNRVKSIETAKLKNPVDITVEILRQWLHGSGRWPVTWEILVECLREANLKTPARYIEDALLQQGPELPPTTSPPNPSTAAVAERNIAMIKGKFAALVTTSCSKLKYRAISVDHVKTYLITMYSSPHTMDGSNTVSGILGSASFLDEIFHKLSEHGLWDYLNYYLLQNIIDKFAHDDNELKGMMQQYQRDLTGHILALQIPTYLDAINIEETIIPTISTEKKHKLFKKLQVKVKGVNITDHSVKFVNDLWQSLTHQFALPKPALILHSIAEGCIDITWLVPANLVEHITKMVQDNSSMFTKQQILKMMLEEQCIYPVDTKREPPPPEYEPIKQKECTEEIGCLETPSLTVAGMEQVVVAMVVGILVILLVLKNHRDHSARKSPQQEGIETEKESALLSYTGSLTTSKYHELQRQFTKLYLLNEYEQLQELSQQTLDDKSISADIKVFALCWQAMSEAVHENYEPAERLLECALKKAKQQECENKLLLQGRVLRHFAHFQYVQGHNDEAEKYMSQAKKMLSNAAYSNEAALALYTELRMKRHTLYQRKTFSSKLYTSIEKEYELLLEHAESMEDYEKPVVFNFFTMKASFHLRSELITDKLPPKEYWPSPDDLRKAEDCLTKAEECLNKVSPDIIPSHYTARYYRTRGDLHIWKHFEQYSQATCYVEKARKLYDEMKVRQNNPLDRVVQQIELLEKVKSHKMNEDYDTALTTFGEM